MDLDELQSVRDRERQTDKLQQLRESFYADAGEFIQQLRRERDRAAECADDPFDAPEVNRLTDEINTAEGTVEAIFERRIGKIVKAASLAAADQPLDAEGMTAEETTLFDDLVDDIVATRQRVLDTLEGATATDDSSPSGDGATTADSARPDAGTEPTDPARDGVAGHPRDETTGAPDDGSAEGGSPGAGSGLESEDGVAAADLMGDGTDAGAAGGGPAAGQAGAPGSSEDTSGPSDSEGAPGTRPAEGRAVAGDEPADSKGRSGGDTGSDGTTGEETPVRKDGGTGVDRETLRITADVGVIFGVDEREYDLAAEDVVQLPAENARPLVERGAAERLD